MRSSRLPVALAPRRRAGSAGLRLRQQLRRGHRLDGRRRERLHAGQARHPDQGRADRRHRQARLPALLRRRRPDQRQGLRERRRLRDRRPARLRQSRRQVDGRAVQLLLRAGPEGLRLRRQPDLDHAGARKGRRLLGSLLHGQPGGRRAQGLRRGERHVAGRAARTPRSASRSAPPASRRSKTRSTRARTQVFNSSNDVDHGAQERPGRRGRRRPADGALRDRGPGPGGDRRRPVPGPRRRPVGRAARQGLPAHRLRLEGDRRTEGLRRAGEHRAALDEPGRRRPRTAAERRRAGACPAPSPAAVTIRAGLSETAVISDRRLEREAARRRQCATRPGDRRGLHGRRPRRPRRLDPDQPRLAGGAGDVLQLGGLQGILPRRPLRLLARREAVRDRRGRGAGRRPRRRPGADQPRPGALPGAAAGDRLRRPLPRDPDDPARLPDRLRRPGAAADRAADRPGRARRHRPRALLQRLRRRGLPGRDRLGPPRPARRGARGRPHRGPGDAPRDPAAGGAPGRAAAAQRLRRPAEGRRPGLDPRPPGGLPRSPRSSRARTSTTRR